MSARFINGLCLFAGFSSALMAANQPLLAPDYLGTNKLISVNSYNGASAGSLGGGSFTAQVKGPGATPNPAVAYTTFWCVDSQAEFSFMDGGTFAPANIVKLEDIDNLPYINQVQYGKVTNAGGVNGKWTNNLSPDNVVLPDSAQDRYRMAAFLITQYDFVGGNRQNGLEAIAGSDKNNAIQDTIWALTNNSTRSGGISDLNGVGNFTDALVFDGGTKTALQLALDKYNSPAVLKDWAVVSWTTNGSGVLSGGDQRQTFLVQLTAGNIDLFNDTPEPGFYGLLCSGLGALAWAANRRKKNADTAV